MFVPVDISIPAADAVGMIGLRQRKRSQRRTNGVIARHVQLGGLLIGEGLYFCINGLQPVSYTHLIVAVKKLLCNHFT